MIGCTVLDVPCTWTQGDFFEPTRRIVPEEDAIVGNEVETLNSIFHSGTHDAYMNLIWRNSDLILVAREPSQDEMEAASFEKVEFDIQAVARDAFVFLVHADNPVESLSLHEIRDIYTGQITNWVQVGGLDAEIHTYQRNRNSGSQELMEKLVMQGRTMRDSPDMILEGMMGPINAIRDDPYGIGYSVYFYAANIFIDENVRMLAVDGIAPTSSSIADNSYSLATEVYAVTRDNTPKWGNAAKLRDWLLTEDGQEAVEASGYVSVSG
jgi:phosphate transport system substrate-binding protein